jgi:drug/metabolite transporter (DMT)-like permease
MREAGMAVDMIGSGRFAGYLALGLVIVGNSIGNVLLKLGANVTDSRQMVLGLLPWQTVAGMSCFAFGLLAYAWALKQFELHAAQVVVSMQYVAAIFLATWILGEQITPMKWLGIGLIALGLFLCAR